jgi:hypothetical protein
VEWTIVNNKSRKPKASTKYGKPKTSTNYGRQQRFVHSIISSAVARPLAHSGPVVSSCSSAPVVRSRSSHSNRKKSSDNFHSSRCTGVRSRGSEGKNPHQGGAGQIVVLPLVDRLALSGKAQSWLH